ncbi:hypothetical protein D9M70_630880 [compost metagenome]
MPADSTAVRITAFIKAAAKAIPAREKTRVNGDAAISASPEANRLGSENGIRQPMMKMAPM